MPKNFIKIEFDIEGEKQIAGAIENISDAVDDLRPPLRKANKLLLKTWQLNFQSEGRELGESWKALSDGYKKWKDQNYPGKKILQREGKMIKNFKSKLEKTQTTLFNTTEYFKYHQSKKSRKSNLSRRVMMLIDKKRRDEIFRFFTKYLDKKAPHFKK